MAKKSQKRAKQNKAKKLEDLPAGPKAKNVKGGSRPETESVTFAFQKVKVGY